LIGFCDGKSRYGAAASNGRVREHRMACTVNDNSSSGVYREMVIKMVSIRLFLMHTLNPMHVYCRLVTMGVDQKTGLRLSRCYEKTVFKVVRLVVW